MIEKVIFELLGWLGLLIMRIIAHHFPRMLFP